MQNDSNDSFEFNTIKFLYKNKYIKKCEFTLINNSFKV